MTDLILNYLPVFAGIAVAVATALLLWMSRRPVRGLYLAFFATAILITPYLPLVREKFTAVEVMMVLTWLAMLSRQSAWRNWNNPLQPFQHIALLLGWFFIAWVALSFFVNNLSFYKGLPGSIVEALNYLYGFLMFRTVLLLVDDWKKWTGCLTAWLLGAVVVSLVGVLAVSGHAPGWAYDEFTGRVSSTLRNENQVPSFLLPVFAATVFMAVSTGRRLWYRLFMILLITGMLVTTFGTGSRTAMGMLVICLLGTFFLALKEWTYGAFNRLLLARNALAIVCGLFLYVMIVLAAYRGDYALGKTPAWQRPVVMLSDWWQGKKVLDETRAQQLDVVATHFMDNIMVGTGPKLAGLRYGVAEIHNTYAGVMFELGVPGCLLFIVWLLYVLQVGWRAGNSCPDPYHRLMALSLCVGMGALIVYSMFMFGLRQRNIWLLAGLLAALPRVIHQAELERIAPDELVPLAVAGADQNNIISEG